MVSIFSQSFHLFFFSLRRNEIFNFYSTDCVHFRGFHKPSFTWDFCLVSNDWSSLDCMVYSLGLLRLSFKIKLTKAPCVTNEPSLVDWANLEKDLCYSSKDWKTSTPNHEFGKCQGKCLTVIWTVQKSRAKTWPQGLQMIKAFKNFQIIQGFHSISKLLVSCKNPAGTVWKF